MTTLAENSSISTTGSVNGEADLTIHGGDGSLGTTTAGHFALKLNQAIETTEDIKNLRPRRISMPLKDPAPTKSRAVEFLPTARWEGAVVERYETFFVADVIDLDSGEEAVVEFDLDQLIPGDITLCEPGSLFYWSVGYEVTAKKQRKHSNFLRFRRIGSAAKG